MNARRGTLGEWHSTPPVEKEKGGGERTKGTSIEDAWEEGKGEQPETRKERYVGCLVNTNHVLYTVRNKSACPSIPIYSHAAPHSSTENNVSRLGNDLHYIVSHRTCPPKSHV